MFFIPWVDYDENIDIMYYLIIDRVEGLDSKTKKLKIVNLQTRTNAPDYVDIDFLLNCENLYWVR